MSMRFTSNWNDWHWNISTRYYISIKNYELWNERFPTEEMKCSQSINDQERWSSFRMKLKKRRTKIQLTNDSYTEQTARNFDSAHSNEAFKSDNYGKKLKLNRVHRELLNEIFRSFIWIGINFSQLICRSLSREHTDAEEWKKWNEARPKESIFDPVEKVISVKWSISHMNTKNGLNYSLHHTELRSGLKRNKKELQRKRERDEMELWTLHTTDFTSVVSVHTAIWGTIAPTHTRTQLIIINYTSWGLLPKTAECKSSTCTLQRHTATPSAEKIENDENLCAIKLFLEHETFSIHGHGHGHGYYMLVA